MVNVKKSIYRNRNATANYVKFNNDQYCNPEMFVQVISVLLEEEKEQQSIERGGSKSHMNISDSYSQIDLLPILEG